MKKSRRSRSLRKLHSLIFLTLPLSTIGILTCINAVKAQQVTSDGTVSTTVTTPDGKNFNINDGTTRGTNLFHSFKEFSIPTGGSATFNNAANIQNIISRVTGGSISTIDGLIRTLGKANLFLLNPAGIIFGPNAQLNIGGSFLGSTANSFLFDNGFEFSATDPQAPPLLTITAPIGLSYRENFKNITSQSAVLEVPQGNSLALVGGNVNLNGGGLVAQGGRIELGGLSTAGTVGLNGDGSLSFPVGVQRADVSLTNRAIVGVFAGGGGNIAVNARNLDLLGGSILGAGIQSGLGTPGAQAGDIKIDATDRVRIEGTRNSVGAILNSTGNFSSNSSNITEPGNAGNIIINTGTLEGNGNILIGSATNGEGNAGRVSITAKDKVSLTGDANTFASVTSAVGSSGTGNGADIIIDTPSLSLFKATLVSSSLGQGNAGNIQLKASESISVGGLSQLQAITNGRGNAGNIVIDAPNAAVSFDANTSVTTSVSPASTGKGGNITIKARNLSVTNGASLLTDTFGQAEAGRLANAGNIQINVLEDISLTGGSQLSSSTYGQGNAGNVTVSAGGKISFDGKGISRDDTGIFSDVAAGAQGNAGNINISGGSVSLNDATVTTSSAGQGNAGNIFVQAQDSIFLDNNSLILSNVESQDEAPAKRNVGNIVLDAKEISLKNGAQLQASLDSGAQGNPGIVSVQARDSVSFVGTDSGIFTDVESGAVGDGSDIQISAQSVSFKDNAILEASNAGRGNGGNIAITADEILFDNSRASSRVENSGVGNAGSIDFNARSLSLTNGGAISTSNVGNGAAGNITVTTAKDIRLDNKAFIEANTNGGEGQHYPEFW